MIRKTSFHRLARQEFDEAEAHYSDIDRVLGRSFVRNFGFALDLITQRPLAWALIDDHTRRKLVGKFPFAIYYTLICDDVYVLAVGHQNRMPFYWSGRR